MTRDTHDIRDMTLEEKMLDEKMFQWAELQAKVNALKLEMAPLEKDIKTAVLELGDTVEVRGEPIIQITVQAKYNKGRGSYNWHKMAMRLGPTEGQMTIHSKTTIDWKKVCQEVGFSEAQKERVYTPGTPSVSLKLL